MGAKPTPGTANQPPGRLGLCLEHAPLPMAMVEGASHIVRYVNPAFCRLMDKTGDELVGKPFGQMRPEKNECVTLLDRVYRTGVSENHTEQEHIEARSIFWSYAVWPVLADEPSKGIMIQVTETARLQGQTVAMNEALMLGSIRQHELTEASDKLNAQLQVEITERKRAEQKVSDHAEQLERLVAGRTAELTATNKQLEAFVYSIAHDLRAPLRSMEGFSTLLVEEAGTALSETGRNYADRINKAAQFMDAMLGDLLAFSRINHEHVVLTPVNLKTVVESVLSSLQKDIQGKNARVESSGPWPVVLADEPTLTQVLFNLTSNALKFVRPGVPLLVRLRAEEQAEFIRVWVEDNGLGIAPDHQAQIFRLFTRLGGEKYAGTGIGLAIVQKEVERMGGRVGVESASGQGSRFWFEVRKAGRFDRVR